MLKFVAVAVLLVLASADHIDKDAQTKSIVNDVNVDGKYQYAFETSNGINMQGAGTAEQATGSAAWVAPGGEAVRFSFVADENGYQPTGDYIHPVPAYIVRALEWNRAHPEQDKLRR